MNCTVVRESGWSHRHFASSGASDILLHPDIYWRRYALIPQKYINCFSVPTLEQFMSMGEEISKQGMVNSEQRMTPTRWFRRLWWVEAA